MNSKLDQFLASRRQVLQGGAAALGASTMLGRSAFAQPAEAISFIGWQFQPQMVEENVGIFEELYTENVNYELVSGEYHPIAETRLIGGEQIGQRHLTPAAEPRQPAHFQGGIVGGVVDDVDGHEHVVTQAVALHRFERDPVIGHH